MNLPSFGDVNLGAVLLKSFLRELAEPILTFAQYDNIMSVDGWFVSVPRVFFSHATGKPVDEQKKLVSTVLSGLPERNLALLRHIVYFLGEVAQQSEVNK